MRPIHLSPIPSLMGTVGLLAVHGAWTAGHEPQAKGPWAVNARGAIVDSQGRERLFHGINVVYKSAPYVPRTTGGDSSLRDPLAFAEGDAKFFRSIGFNVVRLAVMWAGVEPVEGQYNETYIAELRKIVHICAQQDINVILEFHQDALSEMFCGEGVPVWAVENYDVVMGAGQFPWPVLNAYQKRGNSSFSGVYADVMVPSVDDCAKRYWFKYYGSRALAHNYRDLYTNGRQMRDKLASYWAKVVSEFRLEPNIIGYELMNEPGPTYTIFDFPGFLDSHYLQPFYDALSLAMRRVDPDIVILYEPSIWSDELPEGFPGKVFQSRLKHAPGGAEYANRSALAFHYYSFVNFQRGPRTDYLEVRAKHATEMGVGRFVTEWMAWGCQDNDQMNDFDRYLLSWTAWNYKSFFPNDAAYQTREPRFVRTCTGCTAGIYDDTLGQVNWDFAACIARTYAEAVQGRMLSMAFDNVTSVFVLAYKLDASIPAPTVIYANTEPLASGRIMPRYSSLRVDITPQGLVNWSSAPGQRIQIQALPGCCPTGAPLPKVTVTVRSGSSATTTTATTFTVTVGPGAPATETVTTTVATIVDPVAPTTTSSAVVDRRQLQWV